MNKIVKKTMGTIRLKKAFLAKLLKRLPSYPPSLKKSLRSQRPRNIFRPAQSRNIRVTPNGAPQNEASIDVKNNIVLVTANDYRLGAPRIGLYRSNNSGSGFTNRTLPLPVGFSNAGDGIVAFGAQDLALVGGIAFNRDQNGNGISGTIIVYRSTNNGSTFSAPIIVNQGFGSNPFLDKPTLAVDTTVRRSNAYISYTSFSPTGSVILFQRSTDRGRTWSAPIVLSATTANSHGTSTVVGPNGEVYVGWIEFTTAGIFFRIRRSDNGGLSFGGAATVSQITLVPNTLPVTGFAFRTPTFAFLGVDTSRRATRGSVYAVWQDNRGGSANILFSRSLNSGGSWSSPVRVDNSVPGTQNFFPNIAISRSTGGIKVIYYTNRLSASRLDAFVAQSNTGGAPFVNSRLSDFSFNPNADTFFGNPSTFIGDYIGISVLGNNGLIGAWCDTRTGSQDIFAGRILSRRGTSANKKSVLSKRSKLSRKTRFKQATPSRKKNK